MKLRIVYLIIAILISPVTYLGTAYASNLKSVNGYGDDVSWPNCNAYPSHSSWGVVGVNGGRDFEVNSCIFREANWFDKYELYMNTGYPGQKLVLKYFNSHKICKLNDIYCIAYNYGYSAATFTLKEAALQGAHSNYWWLDVETVNSWSTNTRLNRADLQGMVDAIHQNTLLSRVGFYSDQLQWTTITGNWKNKFPNWLATGALNSSPAIQACNQKSFNDGKILLTQYTVALDQNYLCSRFAIYGLSNY